VVATPRRSRPLAASVALALGLGLPACGGGDAPDAASDAASSLADVASSAAEHATGSHAAPSSTAADAAPGPLPGDTAGTPVTATESDFAISLSSSTLAPGTYTFTVENTGDAPHSLAIAGPGLAPTESETVPGGGTTTLTVTLPSGEYEVWCPIGDHRAMGMETTMTVS
jgi:plastocyanin